MRSLGVADALLRVVERAEAAGVALDRRFGASELLEGPYREDVRAGGVLRRLGEGDREPDDAFALAELDDVARLERKLAAVAVVERDAALPAHHRGAVRRLVVAQEVAVPRDDARVLARDVFVGEHDVVALGAPEADEARRRLVTRPSGETLGDLQTDHSAPSIHPTRQEGVAHGGAPP